jgi:hypothetical protein
MEERQELLRKDLQKQRDALISEINVSETELKNKRDYLMKLIGGLEAIDILFGPQAPEENQEEVAEENQTESAPE